MHFVVIIFTWRFLILKDRIKELRLSLNMTQSDFAEAINLKRNTITMVETEQRNLSDRTILDICRVFSVNEKWLRTGEGDMLLPIEEDLDYLVAKYADTLPSGMKAAIVTLLKMPPEKRKAFDDFLEEFDKLRGMKKDQD